MSSKPPKPKAVIYARVSPRPGVEDSDSIETQFDLCTEYCRQNGYVVKSKYCDKGISGAEEDRPGLWDAVKDLESGDTLVVYKLDRLARSVFLSHSIQKMLDRAGATLRSARGEGTWGDTPEDRVLRNILRSFDEYFREVNAKRISDAMKRHIRNGKVMSNPKKLPYGYKLLSLEKGTTKICKTELENIEIIRKLAGEGLSTTKIAERLNSMGIKARTGVWSAMKLYPIMRSHKIAYPYNPNVKILKPRSKG